MPAKVEYQPARTLPQRRGHFGRLAATTAFLPEAAEVHIGFCLKSIEQELQDTLAHRVAAPNELMVMLRYHMGWEHLGQPPAVAGKRIRPLLVLLCASAAGGQWRSALPFAAGVELVHSFSLVHDDIQDASPLRRGRAAAWVKWGVGQAINVGDALFAYAHLALQRACGLPCETRLAGLELLDQACVALSMGQHLDMAFETRGNVTVNDYLEMIGYKTASLMGTAAELGALAAGAPEEVRLGYRDFGRYLGLAFQIRDDVLGIWGDGAVTGKPATSDIETRKKTLPVVCGLERSAELRRAYDTKGPRPPDVPTVVGLLKRVGARTFAEAEERRHGDLALRCLAALHPEGHAAEALQELTLRMLNRAS